MMPRNVIDGNQLVELLQDEEGIKVSRTTYGYGRYAVRIEYKRHNYVVLSYFGGQTFIVRVNCPGSAFLWGVGYTVDEILDIIL